MKKSLLHNNLGKLNEIGAILAPLDIKLSRNRRLASPKPMSRISLLSKTRWSRRAMRAGAPDCRRWLTIRVFALMR